MSSETVTEKNGWIETHNSLMMKVSFEALLHLLGTSVSSCTLTHESLFSALGWGFSRCLCYKGLWCETVTVIGQYSTCLSQDGVCSRLFQKINSRCLVQDGGPGEDTRNELISKGNYYLNNDSKASYAPMKALCAVTTSLKNVPVSSFA